MIYMAPFGGKDWIAICEDCVPARRDKNPSYVKLNPYACVYYMQTLCASLRFSQHLVQNITHMGACLCCTDCSTMLLRRNLRLKWQKVIAWCLAAARWFDFSSKLHNLLPRRKQESTKSVGVSEELLNFSIMFIWIVHMEIHTVNC